MYDEYDVCIYIFDLLLIGMWVLQSRISKNIYKWNYYN